MKEFGSSFEFSSIKGKGSGRIIWDDNKTLLLRSAREALYLIGEKESKRQVSKIFMPALCCSSMEQPFKQLGFEIIYYKLTPKLIIDYDYLDSILQNNSLILLIKYHGIDSFDICEIRQLIGNRNIKIIQDCTQHIFTTKLYEDVDYRVGSIRKWLPIPDGAFLYMKTEGTISYDNNIIVERNDTFIQESMLAMIEKKKYLISGNTLLKKSYRKRNALCSELLKKEIIPHQISIISKKIIENDIDIRSVIEIRKRNYNCLKESIGKHNIKILNYSVKQECPLCLIIEVNNRDKIQNNLARQGVYCQVLWPIREKAKKLCKNSSYFSDHMLAVPCDQRYSSDDMLAISKLICEETID